MKIRSGFVSNSSSSSFLILKRNLTNKQVKQIISHEIKCKAYGMSCDEYNAWSIKNFEEVLKGYTPMDNFSMYKFFECIGVNMDNVEWDEQ